MHLARRLVGQRLMRAAVVVEAEVGGDACLCLSQRGVFLEIHLLILDAAPQPLGEDVIMVGAFAVHADADAGSGQHIGESAGGELAALITVEDVRRAVQQRRFQRLDAEAAFHRRRQPPAHHIPAVPIHDGHQIAKSLTQPDVGDVGGPYLIRTHDGDAIEEVRINRMRRVRLTGIGLWINRLQAHQPQQAQYPLGVDSMFLRPEQCRQLAVAQKRMRRV